jgi:GT2 family glycosyltransferase
MSKLLQDLKANPETEVVKLFVVVVLYKMRPTDSVTLNTLQASLASIQGSDHKVKILLYDNTPGGQDPGTLPVELLYTSDPKNGRLSKAYNFALDIADREGFDWLLTLDQDTKLPLDFMPKLLAAAAQVLHTDSVGAIVPIASSDGRMVSPKMITRHGTLGICFPEGYVGISSKRAHAVNSASTIRVSALKQFGGYDPNFNLWFSDIVMYNRLHRNNFRLFVAGNIHVDHEMSGFDLKTRSTPDRYEEILQTEEAFYDQEMDKVGELVVFMKLIYRLVYGLFHTGGSLPHFKIAFRFLCRRIFYSRQHRRLSWEQTVARRETT